MFYPLATQFLRNDHKTITGLFRQIETWNHKPGAEDQRSLISEEILNEVESHIQLEEELFYPKLKDSAEAQHDSHTLGLIAESRDHCREIEQMVGYLRKMDPLNDDFMEPFKSLVDSVTEQIELEEAELLPVAEKNLSTFLGELGMKMHLRKEELRSTRVPFQSKAA